jgi:hypothetical protein
MSRVCHGMIKLSRWRCKNHYVIVPFNTDFEIVSEAGFVTGYKFKLIK